MPLSSQRGSSCPSIGPGSQHLTGGSESPSSVLWRLERTGLGRDHWVPFWFAGIPGPSLAFNLTSEHPSPDPFPGPPPCTCEGEKEGGQHPHLPTLVNPPEPDSHASASSPMLPPGGMPWLIASLSGEGVTPEGQHWAGVKGHCSKRQTCPGKRGQEREHIKDNGSWGMPRTQSSQYRKGCSEEVG